MFQESSKDYRSNMVIDRVICIIGFIKLDS